MDNTQNKELNCLSLCTGYGGLELGLRLAGLKLRTVAYVEIEAFAVANLVAKIEAGKMDEAPIWTNLKTFNAEPFRGKVDIITGGYPCQPFSVAGKRRGDDDPRHLYPYIERIISTVKPSICFFENVEGHLSQGFDSVQASLRDLGYAVEAGLFTASEVGASHQRKRLFILAYTEHTRSFTTTIQRGTRKNAPEGKEGQKPAEQFKGEGSASIWEYTDCKRLQRYWNGEVRTRKKIPIISGTSERQRDYEEPRLRNKSKLGGATNGAGNRVDRLRMLGNGVVPQQACKAWEVLTSKIQ